jgi:hypothetical protein
MAARDAWDTCDLGDQWVSGVAFRLLARRIQGALEPMAVRVHHVGSTSVPGLVAKGCIDVQVEVQALNEELITGCFAVIGSGCGPSHGIAGRPPPAESWARRTEWAPP